MALLLTRLFFGALTGIAVEVGDIVKDMLVDEGMDYLQAKLLTSALSVGVGFALRFIRGVVMKMVVEHE